MHEETIAAISTPPGMGGIAVVRISGPLAEEMAFRLFRPKKPIQFLQNHHLYHGDIVHPDTGAILDEVMISLMKGPHSYTGEDVLEIHCHGGVLIPLSIIAAAFSLGARPAEAGEFTRRAFLNGRIDLSQAEAVSDMITAQTGKALDTALSQLKGELRSTVDAWIEQITQILAELEAAIEFTEDLEAPPDLENLSERLRNLANDFSKLAATHPQGKILRQGASVVIAGRPNVGKSSLLNRLLGERRAIVTANPGTTRDFIEESFDLSGIPVRITDTAGIRAAESDVEQAGIDLVWERLAEADAVIVLLDGSECLSPEDLTILQKIQGKPTIPTINKSDLAHILKEDELRQVIPEKPVWISAKFDAGLDDLKTAIHRLIAGEQRDAADPGMVVTTLRHRMALEKAALFLSQAAEGASQGLSPELVVSDIREGLDHLKEIGGRVLPDDILDRIFSTFCIGK